MKIVSSIREMWRIADEARAGGKRIGLVPTMGYFHEGHLSLMRTARRQCDLLVVSIFVNPTQFGPDEDLGAYPRDEERDCRDAEAIGADIVFIPTPDEIYPEGYQTDVTVNKVTRNLCGVDRPVHFQGVATVVTKLFNIVKPHMAIFGEKDFQQLATIKRLTRDLNFDIEIMGGPTVREDDGLAMSSRNAYIRPEERETALCLSRSLAIAKEMADRGERSSERILRAVRSHIESKEKAEINYIKICSTETIEDIDEIDGEGLLAIAVKIGKARLIDNCVLCPVN